MMLPLAGKTVLEVGAGIGDHTSFFLDRGCRVTSTDARPELLEVLKQRFPEAVTAQWQLEDSAPESLDKHEVLYAYGILYHTHNPEIVLERFSSLCSEVLLLETCVSYGDKPEINLVDERPEDPTQAYSGKGCRPTRIWIFRKLQSLFEYVYVTKTQPWHAEFPIHWGDGPTEPPREFQRAVFIASRTPLDSDKLSLTLLDRQERS